MEKIFPLMQGAWAAEALYVVTKLGIPAFLAGGPKHYTEIATHANVLPDFLFRVLRLLASVGVFAMDDKGHFSNTELATLSIEWAPCIIHLGEPPMKEAWGKLGDTLKTGVNGWAIAHGKGVFDYYLEHPESFNAFNGAMTALTKATSHYVAAFDWNPWKTIVDIGGGHGNLAYGIVKHSKSSVVVFDLPKVIEGTKKAIETEYADVAGRITAVGGDFFHEIPSGGDLYVLKYILHDWGDADCVRILKTIHKSSGNAKLLILDHVVPPVAAPANPYSVVAAFLDVHMMAAAGGKERTETQWRALLEEGGFVFETIKVVERQNMIFANKK